jgi:hypothetical protein
MKYLANLLAPVLLAALLPSIAAADDRSSGYDDQRYGRSAESRYDRYGGYDATDRRALRELARDLEGWTRAALREAERLDRGRYRDRNRDRYGDRYRELDAVAALDHLADEARLFRREVDRSKKDRWSGREEWYALRDAYFDASDSLRGRRADGEVREHFGRVQDTMDELAYFYTGSRGGDWRSSDRRYDDRGRYYEGDGYRRGDRRYDSDDDDDDDDDD